MHAASENGRPIVLKIELPEAGWLTIRGYVLYAKPTFGYAVSFAEMTSETKARLALALAALRAPSGH